METQPANLKVSETSVKEELLPWHKPTVERLSVALDTATGIGSGTDAINHHNSG